MCIIYYIDQSKKLQTYYMIFVYPSCVMASDYMYETLLRYWYLTFLPLPFGLDAASMPWDVVSLGAVGSGVRTLVENSTDLMAPNKNLFTQFFLDVFGGRSNDFFRANGQVLETCCSLILPGLFMATGLLIARCPFCYSWLLRRPVGSQAGRSRVDCLIAHSDPPVNLFEDATLRSTG